MPLVLACYPKLLPLCDLGWKRQHPCSARVGGWRHKWGNEEMPRGIHNPPDLSLLSLLPIHPIYRYYRSCPSTRFIAIIALAHSQSIQLDLSLLSRRSLLSLSPKSASRLKSTYPFPKKSSFRYSSQATMANALETDPSPSGALDRLPMRWMCLSNQQLAAQSIVCRGGIRRHLQIPQDCI